MKAALFVLVLLTPMLFAASSLGGSLTLETLRHVPNPAEPGKDVTVWFSVFASETQSGVACRIEPDYPFSLHPDERAEKTLGSLSARQSWDVAYKLRVDTGASVGNNTVTFGCKVNGGTFLFSNQTIYVQPQSANLAVTEIVTEPERVEPGQSVRIRVTLANLAGTAFKNVRVTLNASAPFVPIKSGTEKIIPEFPAGQTHTLAFDFLASPDAASKAYSVPVILKFQDNAGTAYTEQESIGVQVGASPALDVEVAESTLLRHETLGKVTLKIVNRGSENVQFLSVELGRTDAYQTTAPAAQYIGSVASDDSESLELDVYAAQQNPVIPVTLSYRDAANRPYTQTFDVRVPTYTEDEIRRFGLEQNNGINWMLVLLVLAALFLGGRWAYGKWKKK